MSGRLDELRDLARHERDVLARYKEMLGSADEVLVQPSGGVGGTLAVLVHVKTVGGDPGTATSQCALTYDVWTWGADTDDDDQRIATAIQPEGGRMSVGRYAVGSGVQTGFAYRDATTGEWRLLCVPAEQPDPDGCEV
jgi:hypothetical protein